MRFARTVSTALIFLGAAGPAFSWTDATRRRMIDHALKLTPPALQTILERYHDDLVRGMLDPSHEESKEDHRQRTSGEYGMAARMLASRSRQAVTQIGQPGHLGLAVYAMGTAAHYTADVNFPLNGGDGAAGDLAFYASYQRYVERIVGRFPVVLNRRPTPELEEDRLEDFGRAAALRASVYIAPVRAAYTPDGKPRSASAFDERSLPFGVASLCYSHAVNDIARILTHIWSEAGGDVRGQPFAEASRGAVRQPAKVEQRGQPKTQTRPSQRPR